MKFSEHVKDIVGTRDRVVCGPQRPLTEEEIATFENEVYKRELAETEKSFLTGLCYLTQYALAYHEAGLDTIETEHGQATVEGRLRFTNDRHERLLGMHPALTKR